MSQAISNVKFTRVFIVVLAKKRQQSSVFIYQDIFCSMAENISTYQQITYIVYAPIAKRVFVML